MQRRGSQPAVLGERGMASRRTLKEEFGVKENKKWGGPAQDIRQTGSEKNDWRGEGDEVMNEWTMMRHWDIRTRGPCGNIVRGTGKRLLQESRHEMVLA